MNAIQQMAKTVAANPKAKAQPKKEYIDFTAPEPRLCKNPKNEALRGMWICKTTSEPMECRVNGKKGFFVIQQMQFKEGWMDESPAAIEGVQTVIFNFYFGASTKGTKVAEDTKNPKWNTERTGTLEGWTKYDYKKGHAVGVFDPTTKLSQRAPGKSDDIAANLQMIDAQGKLVDWYTA